MTARAVIGCICSISRMLHDDKRALGCFRTSGVSPALSQPLWSASFGLKRAPASTWASKAARRSCSSATTRSDAASSRFAASAAPSAACRPASNAISASGADSAWLNNDAVGYLRAAKEDGLICGRQALCIAAEQRTALGCAQAPVAEPASAEPSAARARTSSAVPASSSASHAPCQRLKRLRRLRSARQQQRCTLQRQCAGSFSSAPAAMPSPCSSSG